MPGRKRTAKSLGTRHDLNYFKRRSLSRKWRLWLSLALPLVAVAWIAGQAVRGRKVDYSAGPLSPAHDVFGNQCATCHVDTLKGVAFGGFRKHVPDAACLSCHEAPEHHANQTFTPECASCHREHIGNPMLAKTPSETCTQCHSDLHTSIGTTQFVSHIAGFNSDHPEFALLRKPGLDPGTIAFNHALHLQTKITGPDGQRVQLECGDCHRVESSTMREWPYASAEMGGTTESSPVRAGRMELNPRAGRSLMSTVSYVKNCSGCHNLQFDRRFGESVPHQTPENVHAFMLAEFTTYLQKNPLAWRTAGKTDQSARGTRIYARAISAPQPRSSQEWLAQQVTASEKLLWGKTCRQCHQLLWPKENEPNALPTIQPSNITARWFQHAVFRHQAHQELECTACHEGALKSADTKDVLLPSIKICQNCHNGRASSYGHAENRCFECHEYHNWMGRTEFKGKYKIPDLIGQVSQDAKPIFVQANP